MTPALVLAPLAIAAVLVVSGVAKLRAADSSRSAFHQLQLPGWMARFGAPVLPWFELALAAALVLLPGWFGIAAGVVALGLMVAYLVVIVRALGFDHPVTCGCFGTLGLGLVTRRTAYRNAALVLAAALALLHAWPGRSPLQRIVDGGSTMLWWVVGAAAVAVLARLVLDAPAPSPAASRSWTPPAPATEISSVTDEPIADEVEDYVREPIPYGLLVDEDGAHVGLRELVVHAAQVLVMVNPGCGPCVQVVRRVPDWADRLGSVELKVVAATPAATMVEQYPELAGRAWQDPRGQVVMGFGGSTPSAVLLGADGLMAGGPVAGFDDVERFVEEVIEAIAGAPRPEVDPAPEPAPVVEPEPGTERLDEVSPSAR